MPGWFEDFVDGRTGLKNRLIFMLTTESALATNSIYRVRIVKPEHIPKLIDRWSIRETMMNAINLSLNLSAVSEAEIIISILEVDKHFIFTHDKMSYQVTDFELKWNQSDKAIAYFCWLPTNMEGHWLKFIVLAVSKLIQK